MNLDWHNLEVWGAGIKQPMISFVVARHYALDSWEAGPGEHWAASMQKPPGTPMRPLGVYETKEEAQAACQREANKWS